MAVLLDAVVVEREEDEEDAEAEVEAEAEAEEEGKEEEGEVLGLLEVLALMFELVELFILNMDILVSSSGV